MLLLRRVEGMSMAPALQPGNIVVASRRLDKIRRGDVVIVRHNGVEKIKRVTRVGKEKYYVEGDNKRYSTDSRQFGWIAASEVRGRVIWPRR